MFTETRCHTVSVENVQPSVLSEDELCFVALVSLSKEEVEVRGGGDKEEPSQVLSAGDLPTETDGTTQAMIDLCHCAAERFAVPWPAPCQQQTQPTQFTFLP